MKKALAAGLALATLMTLAACTGESPETEAAPTTTDSPNVAACESFETEVAAMMSTASPRNRTELAEGEYIDAVEEKLADVDTVALSAEGATQDRMLAFVEALPAADSVDMIHLSISSENKEFRSNFKSVANACATDGVEIGTTIGGID